jgi:carboxypeptidase family protein
MRRLVALALLALLSACGDPPVPTPPAAPPPTSVPAPAPAPAPAATVVAGRITVIGLDIPVIGAVVEAVQGASREGEGSIGAVFALGGAETGPDGRFRIEDVTGGVTATLIVRARGYAPTQRAFMAGFGRGRTTEANFELEPAGALVGVLRDPEGQPVPGGTVRLAWAKDVRILEAAGTIVMDEDGRRTADETITDDAGAFRLDGLAFDREYAALGVAADGRKSRVLRQIVATAQQPEVRADLALVVTGRILLRVSNAGGVLVPHATARLGVFSRTRAEQTDDGALLLDAVPPGPTRVTVEAPDHVRTAIVVEVVAGETAERKVTLDTGAAIAGIIVDDTGSPIEGADLTADRPPLRAFSHLDASTGTTTSDEEGRFRIAGLLPGTHVVSGEADDHDLTETYPIEAPMEGLRIVLPRRGRITARLVLPEGASAPEVVYAEVLSSHEMVGSTLGFFEGDEYPWNDGALVLDGVRPTDVTLRVFATGYGVTVRPGKVAPGGTWALGDLQLTRGFAVSGRVVDPQGQPVAGAEITNQDWAYVLRDDAVADEEGRFTLTDLSALTFALEVNAEDFIETDFALAARRGMEPVTITLFRGGRLVLELKHEDGTPAEEFYVPVLCLDAPKDLARMALMKTDERGVDDLHRAAGRYELTLGERKEVVTLEEGKETTATFTVPAE